MFGVRNDIHWHLADAQIVLITENYSLNQKQEVRVFDEKITSSGIVAGVVFWIGAVIYGANQAACLNTNNCGAEDIFLFAIIAIGLLVPAYIAVLMFSGGSDKR